MEVGPALRGAGYSWLTSQGSTKGAPSGERHCRDEHGGERGGQRRRSCGSRADRGPQSRHRRAGRDDRRRLARGRRRDRRPGARQPGRLGGDGDRGSLPLARQAARLAARQQRAGRRHDAGGDRQGPRRRDHRGDLPHRPDQLLRQQGRQVHRRGERAAPLAAARLEEAQHPVPALPGGGDHQPLELPADPGPGRRDPGAAGRRRGGHQAVGVHAAGPGRGGQGLEGGDRRPRRARLRPGDRRDRRRPGRRGRLHPVHRLRPDRAQGDGPGRRDADPGQPRARRQGPDDRPRRRRPRPGGQRRRLRRDDELRPDLHLGGADLRRGARLRRVRAEADQGGRRPAPGGRRQDSEKGRRGDDLAKPDRDRRGPRRRRDRLRRQGDDRRQAGRGSGRLLRTDRAGRRRPLDEGDARRDLRARSSG